MESLAGLVFDGAGVGFEPVYVLAEAGIFFRKLVDLLGQGFVFGAFLLPTVEAVAAVDYVPCKEQRKDDRCYRTDAAPVGKILIPPALEERSGLGHGLGRFWHLARLGIAPFTQGDRVSYERTKFLAAALRSDM